MKELLEQRGGEHSVVDAVLRGGEREKERCAAQKEKHTRYIICCASRDLTHFLFLCLQRVIVYFACILSS